MKICHPQNSTQNSDRLHVCYAHSSFQFHTVQHNRVHGRHEVIQVRDFCRVAKAKKGLGYANYKQILLSTIAQNVKTYLLSEKMEANHCK